MKACFRIVPIVAVAAMLTACERDPQAPAPSAPAVPLAPPPSTEALPENPHLAVDEPLPPFDELGSVPQVVAEGRFQGQEGHAATGLYRIYEIPGDRLLRIEDFQVSERGGLDLVLLGAEGGTVLIAALKGSSGNQNYLLDPSLDLRRFSALAVVARDRTAVYARAPLPSAAASGKA